MFIYNKLETDLCIEFYFYIEIRDLPFSGKEPELFQNIVVVLDSHRLKIVRNSKFKDDWRGCDLSGSGTRGE